MTNRELYEILAQSCPELAYSVLDKVRAQMKDRSADFNQGFIHAFEWMTSAYVNADQQGVPDPVIDGTVVATFALAAAVILEELYNVSN